jgi:branched-chain amino acid transport system substrate-binding protein
MGWKPVHILTIHSTSIGGVLAPAGLENANGIVSVRYGKDPADPTWNEDPGMTKRRAFIDKYYPEGDKNSSFNAYGYATAQLMVNVLEMCGNELTREKCHEASHQSQGRSLGCHPAGDVGLRHADRLQDQQAAAVNGERWVLSRLLNAPDLAGEPRRSLGLGDV